jgi:hypothetical protein
MTTKTKKPKVEKRRMTHSVSYKKGVTFKSIGIKNLIEILKQSKTIVYVKTLTLYSDDTKSVIVMIDNIDMDL